MSHRQGHAPLPTRAGSFATGITLVGLTVAGVVGCSSSEPPTPPATTTGSGAGPATSAPARTTAPPATTRPATSAPATSNPTTTSTTAPTSSTTGAPSSTTTLPTTPQGFATALLAAWAAGDRAAAGAVATPEAVEETFALTSQSWTLAECGGAAGSTICRYTSPAGELQVQVRNLTGGLPMTVTSVRFTPV